MENTVLYVVCLISLITASPPNVVLMIIDDMHFMSSMSECAPSGNTTLYDYDTPNINALYNESVIFTTTYAGGPKCSPSRYTLLTGRHASRNEFAGRQARRENTDIYGATLSSRYSKLDGDDGVYNLANMLQNDTNNPYYTGMVGKWHLMTATDNGYNYGCSSLADTPNATLYAECKQILEEFGFDFVGAWYYENIEDNDDFSHNPEWMVSQSQKFIEEAQDRDQPFFLYFASTLTHSPDANDALEYFDFYGSPKGTLSGSDVPNDTSMASRAEIAASVTRGAAYVWMDDMVGALITYLEDNGLYNETLFIFQNDHGMDDKGTLYQGGSRIMNFVRYPPVFGTDGPMIMDNGFITSNVDVAATIFDLANTTLPDDYVLDGISYWNDAIDVITDRDSANVTCCDYRIIDVYNSHSIVTEQYQYIYRATNMTEGNGRTDPFPNAFDVEQLYNLNEDPNELVNVIDNILYWNIVDMFQVIIRDYLEKTCPADDETECIKPVRKYENYTTTSEPTTTAEAVPSTEPTTTPEAPTATARPTAEAIPSTEPTSAAPVTPTPTSVAVEETVALAETTMNEADVGEDVSTAHNMRDAVSFILCVILVIMH